MAGAGNAPGVRSVTEDLLVRYRALALGRGGRMPPVQPGEPVLLVTYVRATDLGERDPREAVLRPRQAWLLPPSRSIGFGRAPSEVEVAVPLLEEEGMQDDTVPRTAVRISFRNGYWWVRNHTTGRAVISVSAPGVMVTLTGRTPAYPLRSRRVIVTVRARSTLDGQGVPVEHRITLIAPWVPDDLPGTAPAPAGGGGTPPDPREARGEMTISPGSTTDLAGGTQWPWAHQRLLAAWAYPDLIGLPDRTMPRGRLARMLLRQPLTGDDPNERALNGLRRKASRELGTPLAGEANTPAFLSYLIDRRGFLSPALSALHAEYDTLHPDPEE